MEAIQVSNLVKQYKNGVRALDELSLNVKSGEIFALLGPNGAGKSSLINTLTTYLTPTSGTVTMLGKDLCKEPNFVRSQIACVSQRISIDAHLSLMENMIFQSRLYKVDAGAAKNRINTLIDSFGLEKYLKYPTASYSGGVKRRLDIAMNMVSYPKILFLDEPTVGMDIQSRKSMWEMMKKIRDEFGTTIFLTTHYLEEADELSDTICIMKDGHELVQDTPNNLRQYIRQNILKIGFENIEKAKSCAASLAKANPLKSFDVRGISIFFKVGNIKSDFTSVNRWLLDQGIDFVSLEVLQPSLEDVFLNLTNPNERRIN